VFTTNKVKAAPVRITQEHIRCGTARAIVANAGNANACTGDRGLEDARRVAQQVGDALHLPVEQVLVASTGVIGQPLKVDRITGSIPRLVEGLSSGGIGSAAEAIMTTDSFPKRSRFDGVIQGRPYRIVGMAKGAGMIMPNMATMLAFVLSDIHIDFTQLQAAVASSVQQTFNHISVDGDTSTNDTVLMLANGMAKNPTPGPGDVETFTDGLMQVMEDLARMIVRDGEGATKLVRVVVTNAASPSDASKAARTVANSSLVKTAFYGQDPNWGRIMAALGRSEIGFEETAVDIWVDDVRIVTGGLGRGVEVEKQAAERMKKDAFTVTIDLHQGSSGDVVTTCDLTHEYVSINADYRT
jgi:glutamate N-acetyltransferase/amino-acid N-acetyltransferase